MVAMETKVLEYNETHVRVPLPPLSTHHSAFYHSQGKEKSVRVITVGLWPLRSGWGWTDSRLQQLFSLRCRMGYKADGSHIHPKCETKEQMEEVLPGELHKRQTRLSLPCFILAVLWMPAEVGFLMASQPTTFLSQSHLT